VILDIRGHWSPPARITLSDLKHLRQLKIIRFTNVVLVPVPPETRLPLFKTLREIYLKNVPTEWMSGHIFMNLTTLSVAISIREAAYQKFHFNSEQGRNTLPCLTTIRLLQRRSLIISPVNWGPKKLDRLVHMIWGAAEVRKTEYEEDVFHVFCAEVLSSV
jgi:hypothetical protein